MNVYDITILIERKKSYQVEAETPDEAETKALELAIAEFQGADVWVQTHLGPSGPVVYKISPER